MKISATTCHGPLEIGADYRSLQRSSIGHRSRPDAPQCSHLSARATEHRYAPVGLWRALAAARTFSCVRLANPLIDQARDQAGAEAAGREQGVASHRTGPRSRAWARGARL